MKDSKYLNECFDYEATTGNLIWKSRPSHHFASERARKWHSSRYSGHVVRSKDTAGYFTVMVNHVQEKAHRVIWAMHFGGIPDGMQIDHINGDRNCNLLSNLRVVSKELNARNRKLRCDNKTGVNGVCFDKEHCKFDASLTIFGVQKRIGRFDSIDEAAKALKSYKIDRAKEGYTDRHAI